LNSDLSVSSAQKPLPSLLFIPFGLSHIATALQAEGHSVRIAVIPDLPKSLRQVRGILERVHPRLVCLSVVSSKYHFAVRLARCVREVCPEAYIIIGGPHATLNPGAVIQESCFDAVCVGEGEEAIVELAVQLNSAAPPRGIANLWFRRGDTVEESSPRPLQENLDALPLIDRSMWDDWVADRRFPSILLGRGCPNQCTYCCNHTLAKIAPGRWVRTRSPQQIVRELEHLIRHYGDLERVYLEIESFSIHMDYARALCDQLLEFNRGRALPIQFGTNLSLHPRLVRDGAFLQRLREANFTFLNIGLESGSERVRRDILHRPRYSNDDFVFFCNKAHRLGMAVNVFVLLGLPGETAQDLQATIDCLHQCDHINPYPSIFYPYPGTRLFQEVHAMGLIKDHFYQEGNQERYRARISYPGLHRWRIQWALITLYYKVYQGHWSVGRRLSMTLFSLMYVYPWLRVFRGLRAVLLRDRIRRLVHWCFRSTSPSDTSP